ncbi:hypothetical protein D3C85_1481460 [compost metagenome]
MIVTSKASLDDVLYRSQELTDKYLQQGHAPGLQLGAIGLNVAKASQTAQHLDQ